MRFALAIFPLLALVLLIFGWLTGSDSQCLGGVVKQCAQPSHLTVFSLFSVTFYAAAFCGLLIVLTTLIAQQWILVLFILVVLGVMFFLVPAWISFLILAGVGLLASIGIAGTFS